MCVSIEDPTMSNSPMGIVWEFLEWGGRRAEFSLAWPSGNCFCFVRTKNTFSPAANGWPAPNQTWTVGGRRGGGGGPSEGVRVIAFVILAWSTLADSFFLSLCFFAFRISLLTGTGPLKFLPLLQFSSTWPRPCLIWIVFTYSCHLFIDRTE